MDFRMQGSNHQSRNLASRLLDRAFPPRELFLRSGDEVRYLRLSPALQKGTVSVVLCLTGVAAIFVAVMLNRAHNGTLTQRALHQVAQERTVAQDEAVLYRRDLERLAERLEAQHAFLVGMVPPPPEAAESGAKEESQAPVLSGVENSIRHPRLSQSLDGIDQALSQMAGQNLALAAELESIQEVLATTQEERADLLAEQQRLTSAMAELQADQAVLHHENQELETALTDLQSTVTADHAQTGEIGPSVPDRLVEGRWRAARDQAADLQREVDLLTEQWGKARQANRKLAQQRDAIKRELEVMKIAMAMTSQKVPAPNSETADLHAQLEQSPK